MASRRIYTRDKIGRFAAGGKVKSKSGNGGGSEAFLNAKTLGKEIASMRAARASTRSSGAASAAMALKIENYDGPAMGQATPKKRRG
jgi:hypothetical protein